jgi:hypothetical protein
VHTPVYRKIRNTITTQRQGERAKGEIPGNPWFNGVNTHLSCQSFHWRSSISLSAGRPKTSDCGQENRLKGTLSNQELAESRERRFLGK